MADIEQKFEAFAIKETWWSLPIAILAADLSYYWMHRLEHEARILWSYHMGQVL